MKTGVRFSPGSLAAIAGAALLVGCASGEQTRAQVAATQSAAQTAISDAERFGAGERAPVELNNARNKLQQAREAERSGRRDEAERLAHEAQVDAQLASTKAQASAAETALSQVREGITTLQGETRRKPAR